MGRLENCILQYYKNFGRLLVVTIATKECFLELEPAISFLGGQEGDSVLCCPRSFPC